MNKLEITLSFKPLMDGLNRFVSAYQTRMQQVAAFNQRIQNGEVALQKALGQISAVLGGAALVKYARDAREADKVQAQLVQTLRQTGQTGALQALNAQAAALQRLTLFADESVNTVQRLLISFGLTAQQAEGLTEQVLDFAQATGQSAESAAMLLGRTLAGDSDELGRYQIKLDTTKGKVDALRDALGRYAGQARAAVPDAAQRSVDARYADATEDLGRAANAAAVPFFQALLPLLERFAAWATANTATIAMIAHNLGDMAAAAAPLVLAWGGLKGAMSAWALAVNPVRAAIVALSSRSLTELSNALAKTTGGVAGLWTTLRGGAGVLTGIGASLAALGSVAAAALAGWQLGNIINEIEYSGLKVKDWAAIWMVSVKDKIGGAFSWLRIAWTNTSSFLQQGMVAFLAVVRETQLSAQEKLNQMLEGWNKVADKFGLNQASLFDTSTLRGEVDKLNAKLGELEEKRRAAVAAIEAERNAQILDNADLAIYIANQGKPASAAANAPAGASGRPDLNSDRFGNTDKAAADRIARLQAQDLFTLETEMLQAQAAGDQARVDRLKEYLQFKQLEAQLEGEGIDLIQARLDADRALEEQQRRRSEQEATYSRQLGELAIERARIEADPYLTGEKKRELLLPLLQRENELITARIAALERLKASASASDQLQIQQTIDGLRTEQASKIGEIQAVQPQTIGQGFLGGMVQFLNEIPTLAQRAQQAVMGIAQAFSQGVASSITGLITKTMTWRDALLNIGQAVVMSLISAFATMAAQWIAQQIIMAVFGRAIQAAQLAALAPMAAATTAIWAPAATAASIATLGGAAIEGAAAAKMAILSSVIGFATGGVVPGGEQLIRINERGTEAVLNNRAYRMVGADFINGLNAGVVDLAALPGSMGATLPAAADAAANAGGFAQGGGFDAAALVDALAKKIRITNIVEPDRRAATRIERRSAAADDVVQIVRSRRSEIFRNGPA